MAAIGIDLGTTFSVIAHVDSRGIPQTIENSEGDSTTPSVVFFDAAKPVVGREAVKIAPFEPHSIAQHVKRDMGRSSYHRAIGSEKLPPEVVQAAILRKLKDDASLKLGEVQEAVITVPAYYNEPRRKATQDAGRLAGLSVLDIINEPTAAAIAFGVQQGFLSDKGEATQQETVLVYDLGGGTFDVTLMRIDGPNYTAVATAGDVYLGGIDWDRRIVDFVAEKFEEEHGVDPRKDESAMQNLMQEAEDAKRSLTARDDVQIHFAHEGMRLRTSLSRSEFEKMTADLLERTLFTIRKLLTDANMAWDDVTRLLLMGGSSRMPMVHEALQKEAGKQLDRSVSPDEAVAHGAALYASLLSKDENAKLNLRVANVSSHDLGILGVENETGRQRRSILIPRNTRLPARKLATFPTRRTGQVNVALPIVEGGDASGNNATLVGKCIVEGLPSNLIAGSPVEISLTYETNGRLTLEARLPTAGVKVKTVLDRASGLSEEDLVYWQERLDNGLVIEDKDGDDCVLDDGEPADLDALEDIDLGDLDTDSMVARVIPLDEDGIESDEEELDVAAATKSELEVSKKQDRSEDAELGDFLKGLG